MDDCFWLFKGIEEEVTSFIDYLNTCENSTQFTADFSKKSVNFLDTTVSIKDNSLVTDLYCKPTDSHNYLLFDSAHPRKFINSIPYSQYLRIRRICSRLEDFDTHMKEMTLKLLKRGYPLDLLQEAALKARRANRADLLYPPDKIKQDLERTILTTRFDPNMDPVYQITSNNWNLLSHSTLHVFKRKHMVAYIKPTNLRDMLVRANCQIKH